MTLDISPKAELHPTPAGRNPRRRSTPRKMSKGVFYAGIAVLLLIVAIPAYGYYDVYIAPLQEQILKVNDKVYTVGDYVERLRYLQAEGDIYGQQLDYSTDLFKLLDNLKEDEIIRRLAPSLGVTVSDEEVTKAMKERVGAAPREGEQVTDQEVNQRFQELYKQRLAQINLSDSKYRDVVKVLLLRDKVREHLSVRIPTVAEQVRVSGIRVDDEDTALKLKDQAEKGQDFGVLARQNSKDEPTKDNLGDLGWVPRNVMDGAFDNVAFNLPVGQVSEPFFMENAIWIVNVSEHSLARPVEGSAQDRLKNKALEEWLKEQEQGMDVQRRFDSVLYEFVLSKLKEYRTPTPVPAS